MPIGDGGQGNSGRRPIRRRASQRPRTPLDRLKDALGSSDQNQGSDQRRYAPRPPQQQPGARRYSAPTPGPEPVRAQRQPAPPPPPRRPQPPRKAARPRTAPRRPTRTRVVSRGMLALTVIGFLVAGLVGTGAYFSPLVASALQDTGQSGTQAPGTGGAGGGATATTTSPFTVLLMGSDNDGKGGNNQTPLTQTMILVRVNPQTGQVIMLSLPRDLYVPLYTSTGAPAGTNKLDVSFTGGTFPTGAAQAAIDTVQTDFHVQINDWGWIGLQGLVNLIDYVGGVDVVVTAPVMDDLYPADVGTSNAYGYQRLAITPGPQHMTGQQALDYVRSRHESTYGDFSRSARQQQVLVALRAKLKDLNPADLPALSNALKGQVYTNLSLPQITSLLPLARQIQNQNITQLTLAAPQYTTAETLADGDDILQPNMPAIEAEIWKYFPQSQ